MPIFRLPLDPIFPAPGLAEPSGLLAVGGDLSPPRLLAAYREGIFPWYSQGEPILWWSLDPRMILLPEELNTPKSLEKTLRQKRFVITLDRACPAVIQACAATPRPGQSGTWITPEMTQAYIDLHDMGYVHSAEAWIREGDTLILAGGLYGVAMGGCFFGESMFHRLPDASKAAFVTLVGHLRERGFTLIDCQQNTNHLARFGAREVPRPAFQERLREAIRQPIPPGPWSLKHG